MVIAMETLRNKMKEVVTVSIMEMMKEVEVVTVVVLGTYILTELMNTLKEVMLMEKVT